MFAHKHSRFLSLQKVPKVQPSDPPDTLSPSELHELSHLDLSDTPRMITCAMQPLSTVLLDTSLPSPVANEGSSSTRPLTLDDFLNSTKSHVFNRSIRKIPIKRRILGRMKEMMTPAGPDLKEYRRIAGGKEATKEERRKAAICIQKWFRSRAAAFKNRETTLKQIRQQIAARAIISAIRRFAAHRKSLKQSLSRKFYTLCVILIQKTWRGYRAKKAFKAVLQRKYAIATALIKGWKCRRILRLGPVVELKDRIITGKTEEIRSVLRGKLCHQVKVLWGNGEWVKTLRGDIGQKRAKCRTASLQREKPVSIFGNDIGTKKAHKKPFFSIQISKTEESIASTEDNFPSFPAPKPFLKRKSLKISSQKVDFTGVKSRISCWHAPSVPPAINTSLQEFLHFEKTVSQDETLSVFPTENPDFSTPNKLISTESSVETERKPRKSVIPRVDDCSGFIVSLKRIESVGVMREIRELLQKEFEVLL